MPSSMFIINADIINDLKIQENLTFELIHTIFKYAHHTLWYTMLLKCFYPVSNKFNLALQKKKLTFEDSYINIKNHILTFIY